MQPNEQNPVQSTPPASNVPEYLHMEPIPEPRAPRSKKKIAIVASVITAVVLVVGGGIATLLYMSGESDRRLHASLGNALSTKYVTMKTVTVYQSKEIESIETRYDFTDPVQSKLHTTFTYDKDRLSMAGEAIVSGADGYYVRFTQIPDRKTLTAGIVVDQWYRVTKDSAKTAPQLLRSINIDKLTGPLFGDVIVGNLGTDDKNTLLSYIKQNGMYRYSNVTTESSQAVYNLTLDSKGIGGLNVKFAELVDASTPSMYSALSKSKKPFAINNQLYIDTQLLRVMRTVSVPDNDEANNSTVTTTTYSYPDSYSADVPRDFKEAPRV